MKLLSREPDKSSFRISKREYEALLVALRFRNHLGRRPRPLCSDTTSDPRLISAQDDLASALADHRREVSEAVEALLADTERCQPQKGGGFRLTLSGAEFEQLLQALNEVRMGAWERLGCPDFDSGDRPEVSEENFLCFWAFQVTDLFQGELLSALHPED